MDSSRYQQLDGIRGIAIFLVLVCHYVASSLEPESSPLASFVAGSLSLTWSGVDLFFVLSGFLIGGILLDNRESPYYFKTFYFRRFCRIVPLYIGWIFLYLLLTGLAPALTSSPPYNRIFQDTLPLWSYLTFTQNFAMVSAGTYGSVWLGITWSLAIEEQFYLTLPLMIRFISIRKLPYVLVTFIASAPILRLLVILIPPHIPGQNYVLMPTRADALLLGVLAAYAMRQESAAQYLRDHLKALYVALSILLGGAIVLTIIPPFYAALAVNSYGYSILALLYCCVILIAMTEKEGVVSRLTKTPWLCKLGIIAYGVYLFHEAINWSAHAFFLNHVPQLQTIPDFFVTAIALLITIPLAYLSWNLYEKRIVAIGHSSRYA